MNYTNEELAVMLLGIESAIDYSYVTNPVAILASEEQRGFVEELQYDLDRDQDRIADLESDMGDAKDDLQLLDMKNTKKEMLEVIKKVCYSL